MISTKIVWYITIFQMVAVRLVQLAFCYCIIIVVGFCILAQNFTQFGQSAAKVWSKQYFIIGTKCHQNWTILLAAEC